MFQKNKFAILLISGFFLLAVSIAGLIFIIFINKQRCSLNALDVIPRSDWGARLPDHTAFGEQGFYNPVSNPEGWLTYDVPLRDALDTIVVHHTALPLSDGPLEIQQLQMQQRGFADIAYHFVIDTDGRIYEGRDIHVRGAHTGGQNYGKIGVVLMGNFEVDQPTEAQLNALMALSRCLTREYGIDRIAGHRDFQPGETVCPGKTLWPLLPALAERLGVEY